MKNYDEYTDRIRSKAKNIKKRRRIALSCTAIFVLALALTLFVPYSDQLPNVDRYRNSPYYKLIPGLNKATYQPPAHKNNYEWLKDILSFGLKSDAPNSDAVVMEPIEFPPAVDSDLLVQPEYSINSSTGKGQIYEEVTDNQVQGVIEGDLFKRSDKYIYYLRGTELTVYSIAGENSAEVARLEILPDRDEDLRLWHRNNTHLYLSADCTTLTVVGDGYSEAFGAFTVLVSMDVSDPSNIIRHDPLYFTGSLISSRMIDGDLLLIYNHRITGKMDFDKPETFVPLYGTPEKMQPIAPENIYCPAEDPTSARYTVIAKLDGKTLQVRDTAALLSYSQQVYVSQNAVYATYGFTQTAAQESLNGLILQTALTEITGISYTGDSLDVLGTVTVGGSVKDQYSMDEYDGILRVAASTSVLKRRQEGNGENWWMSTVGREYNCNLYCIDLAAWEVAASVIAFAPDGEEVTSARFDGPMGYVCTAEVVIMTDPVYFFDLSDIHNITYKYTPMIDGYSSSLINFGDYLLGIGYGDRRMGLKIEIYEETADAVLPLCAYEREAVFSQEYKSYFIDRENGLIGLHLADSDGTGNRPYVLLHFDGYQFQAVKEILSDKTRCSLTDTRAFLADGYFYILTAETDGFIVTKLF